MNQYIVFTKIILLGLWLGLLCGIQQVVVAQTCTGSLTVNVVGATSNTNLTLSVDSTTDLSCPGAGDGAITIAVAGGSLPYSFLWSNSATTQNINNLAAGTYSVTVTDQQACALTAQATVTESDPTPPSITCGATIVRANDAGQCGAFVTVIPPQVSDNCGILSVVNNKTNTSDASSFYAVGVTSLVWTVTDVNGNTNQCTQLVVVNDNEPPVPNCITTPITATTNMQCKASGVVVPPPTGTDNCGNFVVATTVRSDGAAITAPYPKGTTTVTWTINDGHGNTATCSRQVIVTDDDAPVFTQCPLPTITRTPSAGATTANVTVGLPTGTDNCGTWTVSGVRSDGQPLGTPYPIGTTVITWTANDGNGNTTVCTQNIVVKDTQKPVFVNCPGNISTCDGVATWTTPTATDNSGSVTIVRTDSNPNLVSGSTFPQGVTTITYTATDPSGNVATCSFTVTYQPINVILNGVSTSQGQAGGIAPFYYNVELIQITGGVPPYHYTWSSTGYVRHAVIGTGTIRVTYADNAIWSVTVTDNAGCGYNGSSLVFTNQPATNPQVPINIYDYTISPSVQNLSTGSINIYVHGGDGNYTYQWSGPSGWTPPAVGGGTGSVGTGTGNWYKLTNLPCGWYSVTVHDGGTLAGGVQDTQGWYWVPCTSTTSTGVRGKVGSEVPAVSKFLAKPNPFSTQTELVFQTERETQVSLTLFDINGAKIQEVYNSPIETAGEYTVTLSGETLPSGTYICQLLTSDGFVLQTRLVVVK